MIQPHFVVKFEDVKYYKPVFDYETQKHMMFEINRLVFNEDVEPGKIKSEWIDFGNYFELIAHVRDPDIWIRHGVGRYTPIIFIRDFESQYAEYLIEKGSEEYLRGLFRAEGEKMPGKAIDVMQQ